MDPVKIYPITINYLLGYNNLKVIFSLSAFQEFYPQFVNFKIIVLSHLLCFFLHFSQLSELWRLRSSKRWLAMSKTASRSPPARHPSTNHNHNHPLYKPHQSSFYLAPHHPLPPPSVSHGFDFLSTKITVRVREYKSTIWLVRS